MINFIKENGPWFYLGFSLTAFGGLGLFDWPFYAIIIGTIALFLWNKK